MHKNLSALSEFLLFSKWPWYMRDNVWRGVHNQELMDFVEVINSWLWIPYIFVKISEDP